MKKCILSFILGGIVFGSIVYAYQYSAKDITYIPSNSNWKVGNVKSAIDNLKNISDTTIANLQSANSNKDLTIEELNSQIEYLNSNPSSKYGSPIYEHIIGSRSVNRSVSKTLSKGKYLVVFFHNNTLNTNKVEHYADDNKVLFNYDSTKTEVTDIANKRYVVSGDTSYNNNNEYFLSRNNLGLFYVNIKESEDTLSLNLNKLNGLIGAIVAFQIIPLN